MARKPYQLVVISVTCLLTIWGFGSFLASRISPIINPSENRLDTVVDVDIKNKPIDELTDIEMQTYLQLNHLTPPSTLDYNLADRTVRSTQYTDLVLEFFGKSAQGVFIEAGAFDGESLSNTLLLETMGWKGILVECNPHSLPKLMSKNRKAWIANVGLSSTSKASKVKFFSPPQWPGSAQMNRQLTLEEMKKHQIDNVVTKKKWDEFEVPTFPLKAIIDAIGEFKEFDLLSLDVQGEEIAILEHFPFDLYRVKMIIMEVHIYNDLEKALLKKFLIGKGYRMHRVLGNDYDFVFVLSTLASASN